MVKLSKWILKMRDLLVSNVLTLSLKHTNRVEVLGHVGKYIWV